MRKAITVNIEKAWPCFPPRCGIQPPPTSQQKPRVRQLRPTSTSHHRPHRAQETCCTHLAAMRKKGREARTEDWAGLGSQDAPVRTRQEGPGIDASASRSGISKSLQQRGGAGPGPQVKLPNSCKPSAMNHQLTEASIFQSVRGERKEKTHKIDQKRAQVTALHH